MPENLRVRDSLVVNLAIDWKTTKPMKVHKEIDNSPDRVWRVLVVGNQLSQISTQDMSVSAVRTERGVKAWERE